MKGKGISYAKFQAVIILDGMKEEPIRPRYKRVFKIPAILHFFAEYYFSYNKIKPAYKMPNNFTQKISNSLLNKKVLVFTKTLTGDPDGVRTHECCLERAMC